MLAKSGFFTRGNAQFHGARRVTCSRALRELSVLVGDVHLRGSNAVGIKNGNAVFADRLRRKADAARDAAKKRKRCGLPQALIVNGGIEGVSTNAAEDFPQGREGARFGGPNFRRQGTALDKKLPARMRQPN